MKIAISLPESVFKEAEQFAHKVNRSRSQLYVMAIQEYLARHKSDNITETMNSVCELLSEQDSRFMTRAAQKIISKESW
ncbi:MAG: hypothetical protein L3J12_03415 [Spirochaetales bacterium]|nr:hypothetical protein [Spirochaetales bacterium]